MNRTRFGEIVLDQEDLVDLLMKGKDITKMHRITVDAGLDTAALMTQIQDPGAVSTWEFPEARNITVAEFDAERQGRWFMPQEYLQLDIAQHLLDLCRTPEQLQRVGEELLLFQERGLFDLLRYLRYLVDVMRENNMIWGVGRGSSVSSYVLYLLGVHRVDSMFYDLDVKEFLR
jgi:DNA polymerase III alpha subunit